VSLADRPRLRLLTLCALYVAQGIPWGFTAIAIPKYLGDRGLGTAAIGTALAMTTLPYAFKWVWGPIIDTFTVPRFGRRRPWILLAQTLMAVTILAMILIPDIAQDLELLAWMILIHTAFSALQDVAVDALAVDLLADQERGVANGLMYASKYGGGILGGYGLLTLIGFIGLQGALIVQALTLLGIMIIPLLVRERAHAAPERPRFVEVIRSLAQAFSLRSTIVAAVLALAVLFSSGVVTANAFRMFTQHPVLKDLVDYAFISGFLAPFSGFIGALVCSVLVERVGHRRMAAIASIAMALGWAAFGTAESQWTNAVFVYTLAIWEPFFQAIMSVSLFAVFMGVSWPRVGASQFTAYMALMNFSSTLGFRTAGRLTDTFEDHGLYLVLAAIQLGVTTLLLGIDPTEARRKLPRPRTPLAGMIAAGLLVATLIAMTIYVLLPR
jgi:PAT family beta-lactamase induction signal transducer AmpG